MNIDINIQITYHDLLKDFSAIEGINVTMSQLW